MSFVENCYIQLAIMLNHRKLFFWSAISLSDKSNEVISGQFINIHKKPNDFQ